MTGFWKGAYNRRWHGGGGGGAVYKLGNGPP